MKKLRITIGKQTYDVTVEVLEEDPPKTARSEQDRPAPTSSPASNSPAPASTSAAAPPGSVVSPMAGVIKAVLVKPGDQVESGKALIILEAMKMENPISAPKSGSVKSVEVTEGQAVTEGQSLLVFE